MPIRRSSSSTPGFRFGNAETATNKILLVSILVATAFSSWAAIAQSDVSQEWAALRVAPDMGANVRAAPSVDSEKIAALSHNSAVTARIAARSVDNGSHSFGTSDWTEVQLPDGRRGYVASRLLRSTEADDIAMWWFATAGVVGFLIAARKNRNALFWAFFSAISFGVVTLLLLLLPRRAEDAAPVGGQASAENDSRRRKSEAPAVALAAAAYAATKATAPPAMVPEVTPQDHVEIQNLVVVPIGGGKYRVTYQKKDRWSSNWHSCKEDLRPGTVGTNDLRIHWSRV